MSLWLLAVVIVFLSFGLTAGLRHYAISRQIIDMPNARSSHSVPTPRGGGVAIVIAFLLCLPLLFWQEQLSFTAMVALAGAGAMVAVIGFMDDHGHIAARWRLLGHFSAAAWALFWIGLEPRLVFWEHSIELGWIGVVLAAFYLVWMLNLYNFMDGIDGIASVEAICACLGGCLIYWLVGAADNLWAPLLLAAAVAGFLIWNFPPARIFMGDAGSGFLGIILGVLSLLAMEVDPNLFWSWLILLGVFIADATFTLMRRLVRGDKVYEAHRSHAYQYASRRAGRHLPVTLAVLAINLFWLLPLAVAVALHWVSGVVGLIIGYLPLVGLAIKYTAGKRE